MVLEISLIRYLKIHTCGSKVKSENCTKYQKVEDRFIKCKTGIKNVCPCHKCTKYQKMENTLRMTGDDTSVYIYKCLCHKYHRYDIWTADPEECSYVGHVIPGEIYEIEDIESIMFENYKDYFSGMDMNNNGFCSGEFIKQLYQHLLFQTKYNLKHNDYEKMLALKKMLENALNCKKSVLIYTW